MKAPVAILAVVLTGCDGGIHQRGQRRITVVGSYGEPITEGVVWNAGEGTGQNGALAVGYEHFLADRVSLMGQVTPYRIFNQSDGDVYAGEFQLGVRYYFWEFDLASRQAAVFAQAMGGLAYGAKSIPEEGSALNFTQDTGVGIEIQISDQLSWMSGYNLRHLSNGDFFNDDNPGQNDHHVYTGIAISW